MDRSAMLLGAGLVLLRFAALGQLPGAGEAPGRMLFAELGCAACHTDLRIDSPLRERTPNLSSAGLRYNPAYLFDFLRNPTKVRRHLGRARMPDFRLSELEALSLVSFLETQREISGQWPPLPGAIAARAGTPPQPASREQFQKAQAGGFTCLTCHRLEGRGGEIGIELASVGYRLRPDWVRRYLVAPAMFGVSPAAMPPPFYLVAGDGTSFREVTTNAAERIETITGRLFALNVPRREALEKRYAEAKAAWPRAGPALGEQLFRSLNCAACHRHHAIPPRTTLAAPELRGEGLRVNRAWLDGYVKRPQPIRPFGFRPGDGSRMPDYRLSDEEAAALSEFLGAQQDGEKAFSPGFQPQPLSAFALDKARRLLTEKLSCTGCHRLGGQGGRIGPDLTAVRARLRPDYVHAISVNPRSVAPHAIMPRVPMSEEAARLVVNYLLHQPDRPSPGEYLSVADHALIPLDFGAAEARVSTATEPRHAYLTYCASCHGSDGKGDGFNARYLPVKPTAHADAAYLATRPDDTLYDGIHAGGSVLNKSHLMPPWGASLPPALIQGLVAHLRTLCWCRGPAWSRDGLRQP